MSTVGHKFSFFEAATTAEHVALLGHSVRKEFRLAGSFTFRSRAKLKIDFSIILTSNNQRKAEFAA